MNTITATLPTATEYSIIQLETALNYWRTHETAGQNNPDILMLGQRARSLANVYGMMIFEKAPKIAASALTQAQLDALTEALTAVHV